QILINILSNAVKFTEKGSVSLLVQLEEEAGKITVSFRILDTGIGMSSKDLKVVFQQFEQAKNVQVQSGTGLGLSIVKELVDAMKGEMNVKSTLGKGSEFDLRFSFEKAALPEIQTIDNQSENIELEGLVWVVD